MKHYYAAMRCLSLGLLLSLFACHQEEPALLPSSWTSVVSKDFSEIIVPSSRTPLYSDMESYNLLFSDGLDTKSNQGEVSLEELIDKSGVVKRELNDVIYEQVPFLNNGGGYFC